MSLLSLVLPVINQPDLTEDPKIVNALTAIQTWANGNLDGSNMTAAGAQSAGINQGGQVVKGSAIIATSETRTNTAYGLMPTPDQVSNVVLPSAGVIQVWYQATWQESVSGNGQATLFLGATQMKLAIVSGAPINVTATIGGTANQNVPLYTSPHQTGGLQSMNTSGGYTGDVTTGQGFGASTGTNQGGGPVSLFANAGTYTVAIQFRSTPSGTVTVSNRRLYVQALSFA